MDYKLHTENLGGNLHQAATTINKLGWAKYVVVMDSCGGSTVAVFKMPAQMVKDIRKASRSYVAPPDHDDPVPKRS